MPSPRPTPDPLAKAVLDLFVGTFNDYFKPSETGEPAEVPSPPDLRRFARETRSVIGQASALISGLAPQPGESAGGPATGSASRHQRPPYDEADPAVESPYYGRFLTDIIDDFVVTRGDLSEGYARQQLARAVMVSDEVLTVINAAAGNASETTGGALPLIFYAAQVNSDQTEGRGGMEDRSWHLTAKDAYEAIRGEGVMGVGDGDVTRVVIDADPEHPGRLVQQRARIYNGHSQSWEPGFDPRGADPEWAEYQRLKARFEPNR